MLMNFKVKNYLSFNEEQNFSMVPGAVRTKTDHLIKDKKTNLLRFAAIYGSNASGKSNLIRALATSQKLILDGIDDKYYQIRDKFFRMEKINKVESSTFEYEFKIGESYFAYGFNIILAEAKFTGEWLYELKPTNDEMIYERDILNSNFQQAIKFKNKESKTRFKIYSEDISDKSLLLTELNRNKGDIFNKFEDLRVFKDIFMWFAEILDINFPNAPISRSNFFMKSDIETNKKILELLDSLGTGITDFTLKSTSIEELRKQVPAPIIDDIYGSLLDGKNKEHKSTIHLRTKNLHLISLNEEDELEIKTMYFSHGENGASFTLGEESDGTRRLLDLLEILLEEQDRVYIIDELDRSLHPNLTYKFVQLFMDILKERNVQLIITTHEDRILTLDLLRRDEIWFIEKQGQGNSTIYSLEKFKTRFDHKILNSYLEGRFGAVPIFKELFKEEGEY